MGNMPGKYKRLILAVAALALIVAGVVIRGRLTGSLSTQRPDKRWAADDMSYGYVSAYFPAGEGVSQDDIMSYRNQLKQNLKEASIEDKENSREFIDSYSLESTFDISGTRSKTTSTVNVTVVGGDFFYMHPMELLAGTYISEDDLMEDRVVIDDKAAWFLYGSTDVAGKYMYIGDKAYYIAGVVKPHKSSASRDTYGTRNRIYMSYRAYSKLSEDARITCYEIIYPDMITNFAYNNLRKVLGLPDETSSVEGDLSSDAATVDVVNMNTRFRLGHIWNVMCQYGERSSHTDGIVYPYWENECRRIEDYHVLALVWIIIWTIVMIICLIPYIIMLWRMTRAKVGALCLMLKNRFQR